MTDRELVYLYKNENIEYARDILQERYLDKVQKYFVSLKDGKFYDTPIMYEDLDSLAYIAFNNAIKAFDLKQYDYDFAQAVMAYSKSFLLRYISIAVGRKHRVLNHNMRLEQRNSAFANQSTYIHNGDHELNKCVTSQEKMEILRAFAQRYSKLVKDIIDYRSQGYSNREIAAITHISISRITNTFKVFVKNARKYVAEHHVF
jgi:DNA-directed RNA polymerase specialized sigma subunit